MNDVPEARDMAAMSERPSVARPAKPYRQPEITPLGSLIDLTLTTSVPSTAKNFGPSDGTFGGSRSAA